MRNIKTCASGSLDRKSSLTAHKRYQAGGIIRLDENPPSVPPRRDAVTGADQPVKMGMMK